MTDFQERNQPTIQQQNQGAQQVNYVGNTFVF